MVNEDYVKTILKKAEDRERYLRIRFKMKSAEQEKKELLGMIKKRVWLRFSVKVGKFLGFVLSMFAGIAMLGVLLTVVGVPFEIAVFVALIAGIISPMVYIVLRDVYKDAKLEVERENRELLYTLGKSK